MLLVSEAGAYRYCAMGSSDAAPSRPLPFAVSTLCGVGGLLSSVSACSAGDVDAGQDASAATLEGEALVVRSAPVVESLFSADFESGQLDPGWTQYTAKASTRAAASGEYGVRLRRHGFIEFPLSTRGHDSIAVSLAYRTRHSLNVKMAPSPSGPWIVIDELTSRQWEHREISLPDEANDLEELWVRFALDGQDRFAYLDEVVVTGASFGEPCETDGDCIDQDLCDGAETCVDGFCREGDPVVCNDGIACNGDELCVEGLCLIGEPISCPAHESCEESGECVTWNDPDPAALLGLRVLDEPGPAQVAFESAIGQALLAYTYRATNFDPATGGIWFVVHGNGRTAEEAMYLAAPIAERYDLLVIAPRYPEIFYEDSEDFSVGVGVGRLPTPGLFDREEWLSSAEFSHAEVEHVFEAVRSYYGGSQAAYYLYGHSAGAQFVHRLLTFLPNYRIHRAAASSSGWYTLPISDSLDNENLLFPYGLTATPWEDADLRNLFAAPFTLLVGAEETGTPEDLPNLRDTDPAMAQGENRLERAQNYRQVAEERADELAVPFDWGYAEVLGADHGKNKLMQSAVYYLFEAEEGEAPCSSSLTAQADGLVINEIHADPASGEEGDANGDGVRSGSEDEFVELVNTGESTICLTGWSISDDERLRHRFPVGSSLEPGAAVVVFGGGIPMGDFGGARVQWAGFSSELNLNNKGDIVTLADAKGAVHSEVSWGNCGDADACADEHIEGSLSLDRSVVRVPELTGNLVEHPDARYSPGVRVDGTSFDHGPLAAEGE
ncbi:MAG: lamin tail domain-containing protein [Myxococcales bacterium FL481]|nr:MAG: lamin tail domain-containing protein [Myxococcales bacterium FL481]